MRNFVQHRKAMAEGLEFMRKLHRRESPNTISAGFVHGLSGNLYITHGGVADDNKRLIKTCPNNPDPVYRFDRQHQAIRKVAAENPTLDDENLIEECLIALYEAQLLSKTTLPVLDPLGNKPDSPVSHVNEAGSDLPTEVTIRTKPVSFIPC